MILLVLGTFVFLVSPCYMNSFSTDNYLKDAAKCFWHMKCIKRMAPELKNVLDPVLDETLGSFISENNYTLPPSSRPPMTLANARSLEAWKTKIYDALCNLSLPQKDIFVTKLVETFYKYLSEKCVNHESENKECVGLRTGMDRYQALNTQMTESGECTIQDFNG